MTYSDIAEDVKALYYASLWFQDPSGGGIPMVDITVSRYITGGMGQTFYAEFGTLIWEFESLANKSVSR